MKFFFVFFILFFSSSIFAEDISDFEIEGISIGDSALDFFTLEEITNNFKETSYKKKDYHRYSFYKFSFFKKYESILIYVKPNDEKYIIHALAGGIFYEDIKECLKEKDEAFLEIKKLFDKKTTIEDVGKEVNPADKTGESVIYSVYFYFNSDAFIKLKCSDVSEAMTEKYNWYDNLGIELISAEFSNWLDSAY